MISTSYRSFSHQPTSASHRSPPNHSPAASSPSSSPSSPRLVAGWKSEPVWKLSVRHAAVPVSASSPEASVLPSSA